MSNEKVNPLDSMDVEIKQLKLFHEDLTILDKHTLGRYAADLEQLRDLTNNLRAEYRAVYNKILTEHPELKKYIGGV